MSKKSELRITSKTDVRYWREAVFRPRSGKQEILQQFYVKIQYLGKREAFPLHTNNQDEAAGKAKRIYLDLVSKGWDAVLAKEKPTKLQRKASVETIGDLISAAMQRNDIGIRTPTDYSSALRQIVAQLIGIGKHQREAARRELRRRHQRLDAFPLSKLNSQEMQRRKQQVLGAASLKGPIALRHTKNTFNSTLRKAKALFSPKFLRHLDLSNDFKIPSTVWTTSQDNPSDCVTVMREDVWVLLYCEVGLKDSEVDPNHQHSAGERGLLPLPSNVKFWNGNDAPNWDKPMRLALNIEHLLLCLGALKNKDVTAVGQCKLYRDLFRQVEIRDSPMREADRSKNELPPQKTDQIYWSVQRRQL